MNNTPTLPSVFREKYLRIQIMEQDHYDCTLAELDAEKDKLIDLFFQVLDTQPNDVIDSFIHNNAKMIREYLPDVFAQAQKTKHQQRILLAIYNYERNYDDTFPFLKMSLAHFVFSKKVRLFGIS